MYKRKSQYLDLVLQRIDLQLRNNTRLNYSFVSVLRENKPKAKGLFEYI